MEKDETSSSINSGGSSSKRGKSVSSIDSSTRGQQPASTSVGDMSAKIDSVFDCVIPYIHDGNDRNSFSLVCRKWYELDSVTRKHVTVHMYYVTKPSRLLQRFPFIESLTLKGLPFLFQQKHNIRIIPWILQIAVSFNSLKALHLHSMILGNWHLEHLAKTRGKQLRILKITRCRRFSTDGLLHITKYCNHLKTLCLERNWVTKQDRKWLHELALHSTCLESFNFDSSFTEFDVQDLVLLAKNCSQCLVSLKLPKCNLVDLRDLFRFAVMLEEFGTEFATKVGDEEEDYAGFQFPPNLRCIGLESMTKNVLPIILPFAHQLIELDLLCAVLNEDDHCFLVQRCPNLEVLYTRPFRNKLLQVISQFCKKLRKFKAKSRMFQHGHGSVSQRVLIALSQGCLELECLHIHVKGITNKVLECIGAHLKNLRDFKIILHNEGRMRDRPLDNGPGVQALLIGCTKLERLYIHLRPGRLTDVGLGYIGRYSLNLRYLFLGYSGESDAGLVELSKGCPKLRKLKLKCGPFSDQVVANFLFSVTSLRYMWAEDYLGRHIRTIRPNFEQVLF